MSCFFYILFFDLILTILCSTGFKWNSGGKGRYTVDSPAEATFGEKSDVQAAVPETLTVPAMSMFPGAAVPMTGEMLEAARVAAEGNAVDPNAQAQAMVPNVASFVTSGVVPVPQVPANIMPFMGAPQQQQVMGIHPQAQAFNYAQQLNLLRYQQLAQTQQQQQQQQNGTQNNVMVNSGLVTNTGGTPFVNMPPP